MGVTGLPLTYLKQIFDLSLNAEYNTNYYNIFRLIEHSFELFNIVQLPTLAGRHSGEDCDVIGGKLQHHRTEPTSL